MPRGIYSQFIKVSTGEGFLIFISGQQADKDKNNVVLVKDIESQTRCIFKNIESILAEAGATKSDIIKTNIFLTNIERDFMPFSRVRDEWIFELEMPPVSTLIQAEAFTRKDALVEIDIIAFVKKSLANNT